MDANPAVAVLDGEAVKAIPIVRALGAAGYRVHLVTFERLAPAAASRWCDGSTHLSAFDARRIRALLDSRGIRVVLPLEDHTMAALHADRDLWADRVLIQPDPAHLQLFRDKGNTVLHARSRGVTVPRTVIPVSLEQGERAAADWTDFPVVIKPRISSGSRGIRVARDGEAALAAFRRVHRDYPLPLLQQYIPPGGRALGVEFLMYRGREAAVFAHQRLRQFPVSGGPSTYCRGCTDPHLLAAGRRVMEGLGYSGFAMVEFREDPRTGALHLMEVNPRPWGSISLPLSAGVDFAVRAVEVFSAGEAPVVPPRIPEGAADSTMRWLLPADFLNLLTDRSTPWKQRKRELFRRYPDTVYQILSRDDPGPARVMFLKMLAGALNPRFLWRHLFRR